MNCGHSLKLELEDSLITETLSHGGEDRRLTIFQTQLLKLYFLTTLYVDVKEPALMSISGDKKTQSCLPEPRSTAFRVSLPGQN
jgi:hypothetical protein